MTDVMIDLETLGTRQTSVITSIGACEFDLMSGVTGSTFHKMIEWEESMSYRTVDGSTIKWWMQQPSDARREFTAEHETITLNTALEELTAWMPNDATVWANGSTFDIAMLQNAYESEEGRNTPWKFYNVNDCRTIERLAQGLVSRKDIPFEGVKHNALADAIHQAKYISAMWQALKK